MQPYPGATWTRALERAMGTVFGCLITAALMAVVHAPWALALVMFPLSVAAVYTKPRSYRLFTFFRMDCSEILYRYAEFVLSFRIIPVNPFVCYLPAAEIFHTSNLIKSPN
ncbi:MAG: FUSC family protein [Chitinophagaceae bacterium]|nr:MAG: FUSC family protein [Chitinophagaceae bacterium]